MIKIKSDLKKESDFFILKFCANNFFKTMYNTYATLFLRESSLK